MGYQKNDRGKEKQRIGGKRLPSPVFQHAHVSGESRKARIKQRQPRVDHIINHGTPLQGGNRSIEKNNLGRLSKIPTGVTLGNIGRPKKAPKRGENPQQKKKESQSTKILKDTKKMFGKNQKTGLGTRTQQLERQRKNTKEEDEPANWARKKKGRNTQKNEAIISGSSSFQRGVEIGWKSKKT